MLKNNIKITALTFFENLKRAFWGESNTLQNEVIFYKQNNSCLEEIFLYGIKF